MSDRFVTRGFVGRRGAGGSGDADIASRIPPGQYLTKDFPVLSARADAADAARPLVVLHRGPGQRAGPLDLGGVPRAPGREWVVDISCVTKWTKLDMRWHGVSVDTLLERVELDPRRRS